MGCLDGFLAAYLRGEDVTPPDHAGTEYAVRVALSDETVSLADAIVVGVPERVRSRLPRDWVTETYEWYLP